MILVLHNHKTVTGLKDLENNKRIAFPKKLEENFLVKVATKFPDKFLIWCYEKYEPNLNIEVLPDIFHHNLIMASYGFSGSLFHPGIGYVEESPFIRVPDNISYPTWQMRGDAGGIHAQVLLKTKNYISFKGGLEYYLNSLGKLGQEKGLFCYSEPSLFKKRYEGENLEIKRSKKILFQFVRQHYKLQWLFLLFWNFLIYEKKFTVFPLLSSFLFQRRRNNKISFTGFSVDSTRSTVGEETVDVVIPTIGRQKLLQDVLYDLKEQTILPQNVIIIEQSTESGMNSQLTDLISEEWPFKIKHIFTHQLGVCNARNLGLAEVESEWVFFNDDDNRFGNKLIEDFFLKAKKYGVNCGTTSYNRPGEKNLYSYPRQTTTFGAGNSFVKSQRLKGKLFSKEMEFGYGEDKDFGMQLRMDGVDIIYFPDPVITHLNASSGGFRTFKQFPWENQPVVPKPAPTLMWFKRKYLSREQLLGYKTVLFVGLLKQGKIKEMINFSQKWRASVRWADTL